MPFTPPKSADLPALVRQIREQVPRADPEKQWQIFRACILDNPRLHQVAMRSAFERACADLSAPHP
jgi:hypothetical protein